MFLAYLHIYARLGLKAIPMKADTGPIGGDLCHEFIILAETGESEVFAHRDLVEMAAPGADIDWDGDLQPDGRPAHRLYAATDEMHDAARFEAEVPERQAHDRARHRGRPHLLLRREILRADEGHGRRARRRGRADPRCGSYGVGVSRLVGAIIEASHDDAGIIWPDAVAPFEAVVVNLRPGDAAVDAACEQAYSALTAKRRRAAVRRPRRAAGAKFATADLIGIPWQLIVGPKGVADGVVEIKRRATACAKL